MSPLRVRKALRLGPWLRVNVTARSVVGFLRGQQRAPWSSVSVGPRGASYNTRRRTARIDLPGPFSYETSALVERAAAPELADWLDEWCPRCDAQRGYRCLTSSRREAARPHAARLDRALARLTGPDGIPPWGTPPPREDTTR